jgi:hypothetical protein
MGLREHLGENYQERPLIIMSRRRGGALYLSMTGAPSSCKWHQRKGHLKSLMSSSTGPETKNRRHERERLDCVTTYGKPGSGGRYAMRLYVTPRYKLHVSCDLREAMYQSLFDQSSPHPTRLPHPLVAP